MPKKPNKITEEALWEARDKRVKSFDTVEELFEELNEEDSDAEG